MKKFAGRTFLFLIGLYVLALIPDTILTLKIKNSVTNKQPWSNILSGNMNNDLLILGSSRAWVHYSPKIIDSVLHSNSYNLGRNGKKMDISILCYDQYIKYNQKPNVVLCDIYYMTMCESAPLDREQFYPFLLYNDIWKNVHVTHKFRIIDRFLPMAKYFGHLKGYKLYTEAINDDYKGYSGKDFEWDGTELRKIESIPYEHDSTILTMTERWLNRCQKDSVKVIFVHSPLYFEATNKINDTAAMWTMYRSLSVKYNVPILDYTLDSICFDTTLFYNAQHLNRKGAERFSRILAKDLDSMGVIQ